MLNADWVLLLQSQMNTIVTPILSLGLILIIEYFVNDLNVGVLEYMTQPNVTLIPCKVKCDSFLMLFHIYPKNYATETALYIYIL